MQTIIENNRAVGSSCYWGERGHWFIAYVQHRDSDCLTRSNFRCFKAELEKIKPEAIAVESFNHWAVGWVEYLLVDPESAETVARAEEIRAKLEDYPVVDESDWSELEMEEADQIWRDCYRPKERLKYIREHRRQFEFRDFQDMLACVRGKYFAGYASELVS